MIWKERKAKIKKLVRPFIRVVVVLIPSEIEIKFKLDSLFFLFDGVTQLVSRNPYRSEFRKLFFCFVTKKKETIGLQLEFIVGAGVYMAACHMKFKSIQFKRKRDLTLNEKKNPLLLNHEID